MSGLPLSPWAVVVGLLLSGEARAGSGPWTLFEDDRSLYAGADHGRWSRFAGGEGSRLGEPNEIGTAVTRTDLLIDLTYGLLPGAEIELTAAYAWSGVSRLDVQPCDTLTLGPCRDVSGLAPVHARLKVRLLDEFGGAPLTVALGALAAVLVWSTPAPPPATVEPVVQVPSEPGLPADLLTPTAQAPPPIAPTASVSPAPSPPARITPTSPIAGVEAPPASASPTNPAPELKENPENPPVATEPTPTMAPEITEAPPEPSPPADALAPDVSGVWVGVAGGRPLTLRLRIEPDGAITARAEIAQGSTVRGVALRGGWQDQTLVLSGQDGETFAGTLDGAALSGRWTSRTGARASSWSATRR